MAIGTPRQCQCGGLYLKMTCGDVLDTFAITCMDCNMETVPCATEAEAWRAWNDEEVVECTT